MHIPDGYLGPLTSIAMYGAMAPAWALAGRSVRGALDAKEAPAVALGAAFSFVVMLFNVPTPGGTTGHAVGAALAAIALGPAAAVIAVTVALAIQALLFGDGGLLTLGANAFNMALVMPLAGFAVYQAVAAGAPGPGRRALAAGLGGYVGVNLAALATAVELGLQPALEPGHCPYGLGTTIPAMMTVHLLVVGFVEAAVTAGVVRYLARGGLGERPLAPVAARARAAWVALGALCLLSPLGLLAAGTAWGEWAPDELKERLGYTPPGLARLAELWKGLAPDYEAPGIASRPLGYVLSAVVGVAVVAAAGLAAARLLARRKPHGAGGAP